MPIANLFNKKCSWRRKSSSQEDQFGESIYTETLIRSDVACAFQQLSREEQENIPVNANIKTFELFLPPGENILPEDIVTISDINDLIVKDVMNDAGRDHHLEVWIERVLDP